MDSIKIDTGEIRLCVNGDESRVVSFSPKDLLFAEKFYKMLGDVQQKSIEYQKAAEALEADTAEDADGLPLNMGDRLALLRETCNAMRQMIDDVFGSGTSQKVFGDAVYLEMFSQFLDGVSPHFGKARASNIAQYLPSQKPARGTGRNKRKRMK